MAGQGAYILGCEGPRLTRAERDFFETAQPWAFILFARNVEDPDQLRALTAELRGAVGRDALIMIDQEGGRVQRLRAPHWREFLPALDQVELTGRAGPRAMYLRARLIADDLHGVGIDANCAPVVDVAQEDTHPVLKNRCLGRDVVAVAENAGAFAAGLLDGGVLPVVKHIPGHGRAEVDSHEALPRVSAKLSALKWTDFMAFEPFVGLPMAMTAHVVYEALDPEHPATQSAVVLDAVRNRIGFTGLLISDDISMQALDGPVELRARAALRAGCDVILHCNGDLDEMREIAGACGRMHEVAQARADDVLHWRHAPRPIDIPAAEAEFQALVTGQAADG